MVSDENKTVSFGRFKFFLVATKIINLILTSNDGDPHPLPSKLSSASASELNRLRKLSWHASSHFSSEANLQQCKSTGEKKLVSIYILSVENRIQNTANAVPATREEVRHLYLLSSHKSFHLSGGHKHNWQTQIFNWPHFICSSK